QLIRAIDHEGTLAEQAPPPAGVAVADGSWALYMRRRLPDYQGFLERIRELYRDESVATSRTRIARLSPTAHASHGQRRPGHGPALRQHSLTGSMLAHGSLRRLRGCAPPGRPCLRGSRSTGGGKPR